MKPQIIHTLPFAFSAAELLAFCEKHHIQQMAVFGSALTGEFNKNSDVDLLVKFEPGHTPGLDFFAMQDELSEMLDRKVDLNTPNFLSRYFRDQVMADAEVLIDRAG